MSARWPAPDFLRRTRPVPWLSWVLLLVGAAVLIVALNETWSLHADVELDRAEVAALERRLRSTARPRVPVAASTPPAAISLEVARTLRRTEAQLQQTWDRAFVGLEQATVPGVRWLALEIEGNSSRLRAEGVANDVDAVLAVVDSMASRSGWSDVVLNRLQLAETGGATTQRFEVSARWSASGSPASASAPPTAPSPVGVLPGPSR